jgi:hypothetical protein
MLVKVTPGCFVFAPGKSSINVQLEILDFFLGEFRVVCMDLGARFSSCGECYVERLRSGNLYSPFFKTVLDYG